MEPFNSAVKEKKLMKKEFGDPLEIRNNALLLARRIHQEGFVPDVIYVSLRGGALIGNVISEYFKLHNAGKTKPVLYAAVVAHSYSGINQKSKIRIDGWTYNPKHLRAGDKILLVDDIFDSGKTINHLVKVIVRQGVPRHNIKVAVHDYKIFTYLEKQLPEQPDYYCRKHLVSAPNKNIWIHYASHELVGLTIQEREDWYLKNCPELYEPFRIFSEL